MNNYDRMPNCDLCSGKIYVETRGIYFREKDGKKIQFCANCHQGFSKKTLEKKINQFFTGKRYGI